MNRFSLSMFLSIIFFLSACSPATSGTALQKDQNLQEVPVDIEAIPLQQEEATGCAVFVPPWGDEYWYDWWMAHPDQGQIWFESISDRMKQADLSIIPTCTQLTSMFVGFAGLKDLSLFSGLTNLRRLDMRISPDVTDLSPLSTLKNLEYLNIWGTGVQDLTPLIGLSKLTEIDAKMAHISDLAPLLKMKQLKRIDLLQCPVTDISILAQMPNITEILTCSTQITDLTPLFPVAQRITYLDLCNTPLRDLNMLKPFTKLKMLKLWGVPITDLSLLNHMKELEYLDLAKTPVVSLAPLYDMKMLKTLIVTETKITQEEITNLHKQLPNVQVQSDQAM